LCTSHHQECGEAKAYFSVARYLGRLLCARQAPARRRLRKIRYVSEWWSITITSSRRTTSYPIDCAEFPDAKATEGYGQLPAMKHCIYYVRGENSTYTTMLDTGIAVSSISRVEFITRQGQHSRTNDDVGRVPVANPIDLRVVLDKILLPCQGGSAYKNIGKRTKNPEWPPSTVLTICNKSRLT
jgi:hypothetical protein